jgi:predicted glycogen debranching enzyme
MPMYELETGGRLEPHLHQEWMLSNGMGAFSSSTVVGCNTRRYHGLLCAATLPPVGRVMALSRIGEILFVPSRPGEMLELSVNEFAQGLHPRGDKYLRRFSLQDTAKFEFEVEGVRVTKEVQLLWMKNVVAVRYTIEPGNVGKVKLWLLPFVALRDFHSLKRAEGRKMNIGHDGPQIVVREGENAVYLRVDGADFQDSADWWYGVKYSIETERGLDDTEDQFCPGRFEVEVEKTTTVTFWASTEPISVGAGCPRPTSAPGEPNKGGETPPLQNQRASLAIRRLIRAAEDFVVARKCPDGSAGTTVIAGYPWFADWGRDTMISLPGLLLTTGRFEEARQVLTLFASYVSEGMIPNRFDDYTNEPSYNTVDASLWFIHACYRYLEANGDRDTFEKKLLPACRAIVKGYREGTRFHIKMDPSDGLISQGDAKTQLTWMDAKCGDVAFTPRQGKPVEINALWYNALVLMGETDLAAKVWESFTKVFWISPFRGLADTVDGGNRDLSIRPNQIFAASLPNSPLSTQQQAAVVEVVRRELLTPMGLRTLAASDPKYHGKYLGDQWHRDEAYHNGTVWPWPLGAFLEAYLRVNKKSAESVAQAKQWLRPLLEDMEKGCIGQIAEIYEGDAPHRRVGCFAQAWSVAEVLRVAVEIGM